MEEQKANVRHVELFKQNIGRDDIHTGLIKNIQLPGVLITCGKICESDLKQLKNNINLKKGAYHLYLKFNNTLVCLGKIDKNADDFYFIQHALHNAKFFTMNTDGSVDDLDMEDLIGGLVIGHNYLDELGYV